MADKANGVQPVAWLKRNGRVFVDSAHTNQGHAERSAENDKGAEVVPLVLASDYEQLRAKLEAAERDAARYGVLRAALLDKMHERPNELWELLRNYPVPCDTIDFDRDLDAAAIDAQRQEGK